MDIINLYNYALSLLGVAPIRSVQDPTATARILNTIYPFVFDEFVHCFEWPSLVVQESALEASSLSWMPETAFAVGDHCIVGSSLYQCITAGTSGLTIFTESKLDDITDGTVHWKYRGSAKNSTKYVYQYLEPNDMDRLLSVGDGAEYKKIGFWIYTDVADAVITYVKANIDNFDSGMIDALAYALAAKSALALGVNNLSITQIAAMKLAEAKAHTMMESSNWVDSETRWVDL